MNTGQMLLIIGALTLLATVTLAVNSLFLSKTTTILQAEASLTAISIAQSMIDEIKVTAFDSAVVSKRVYHETKFTPAALLGPEASDIITLLPEPPDTLTPYKSLTKYNDVDDYNGYKRYYYSTSLGTFTISDTVYYVRNDSVDVGSASQTFFKKIIVTIRHPNLAPIDVNYNPWTSPYVLTLSDVAVYRRYF